MKIKIIAIVVILFLTFALGRYTAPTVDSSKTTVTDVKRDVKNEDKQEHKKIVIVEEPGGKKTTVITDDQSIKTLENSSEQSKTDTTVVAAKRNMLNISLLYGTQIGQLSPIYGLSVSKEFIGPITIGLWGHTDSTVGISVGLNF